MSDGSHRARQSSRSSLARSFGIAANHGQLNRCGWGTYIGGAMTVVITEFAIKINSASVANPSSRKSLRNTDSRMDIRTPNSTHATPVRTHTTTCRCQFLACSRRKGQDHVLATRCIESSTPAGQAMAWWPFRDSRIQRGRPRRRMRFTIWAKRAVKRRSSQEKGKQHDPWRSARKTCSYLERGQTFGSQALPAAHRADIVYTIGLNASGSGHFLVASPRRHHARLAEVHV